MKLHFVSRRAIDELRKNADQFERYDAHNEWFRYMAALPGVVLESERIVGPVPALQYRGQDLPRFDAENAKQVFSWLRDLPPTIAMDARLWTWLTHHVFADYMHARWTATSATRVTTRYLLESGSFGALTHNGISRLWWAGYLTHDPQRRNPFELTEVLFKRQDIHTSLLERAIGKSRVVRQVVLEYLRTSRGFESQDFGKRIQTLLKEVNLLAGVTLIDSWPKERLRAYVEEVGARIVRDNT